MSRTGVRRGLVLGAGGVLGAAWTVGALEAVQDHLGWDPRDAEVIIGTSAGSVMTASLACGITVEQLRDHQRGITAPGDPVIAFDPDKDSGGALPPLPRPLVGSPRGVLNAALHPRRTTPMMAMTAMMPQGRGSLAPVGRLIDQFVPHGEWAPHPATWVVAMDFSTGRRTVFGRDGAPGAGLSEAVTASCSIPGWYAPVKIGRHRYVDGGVCSPTSLDLVTHLGLDEVVVLSPMTSLDYDSPADVATRVERRLRRVVTRRLVGEVKKVAATGTRVTLLHPGRSDLAVIGANMMDPRRRTRVLATSIRTSREALVSGRATAA